jgi:dihydroxy-acid dehydratase
MTMGTASTMAVVAEALGIAPPGNAAFPAADSRRQQLAERVGGWMIGLVQRNLRPSQILTAPAFENAIRTLHCIGGSTNAIVHLIAIAGRLGIDLRLQQFDQLSDNTPLLLDLKPSGRFLMEDFCYAGGGPALLKELAPLLSLNCITVTGRTLGEHVAGVRNENPQVIRPMDNPLAQDGGLAVLHGSLAPDGAIIKRSAASPDLLEHRGRAVVFENHDDLLARIDADDLDVRADDVLVLRNAGPLGGPGMPEWGLLPVPRKLLSQGVEDIVRISDARISGTAFGTVIVHAAPEAAAGGPLAAVRNGDMIELSVAQRRLELLVDPDEIARRLATSRVPPRLPERGYRRLYAKHVLQANQGCDFDFLRAVR